MTFIAAHLSKFILSLLPSFTIPSLLYVPHTYIAHISYLSLSPGAPVVGYVLSYTCQLKWHLFRDVLFDFP